MIHAMQLSTIKLCKGCYCEMWLEVFDDDFKTSFCRIGFFCFNYQKDLTCRVFQLSFNDVFHIGIILCPFHP